MKQNCEIERDKCIIFEPLLECHRPGELERRTCMQAHQWPLQERCQNQALVDRNSEFRKEEQLDLAA
jgi:hypothetical protein